MCKPESSNVTGSSETEPKAPLVLETGPVGVAVRSLFENGSIDYAKKEILKDPANKKIIDDALAFIESPTEDLEVMRFHVTYVGMVLSEFGEIDDQPRELKALQGNLFVLISERYIELIEIEFGENLVDKVKIQQLITQAINFSETLKGQYNEGALFDKVIDLQQDLAEM